jgi:hypothetical protein
VRRTGILSLFALISTALVVWPATSASAAAGVIGHIDKVTIQSDSPICVPENMGPCSVMWSDVTATGWAFNPRTVPVQEVYLSFQGWIEFRSGYREQQSWNSHVYVANKTRTDVQRHYGLNTAAVGYSLRFQTPSTGFYIGTVKVCLHARDHGTKQAWRTVACKSVTATQ